MTSDNAQRDIIIAAATTLFSRFGLEKTTMEDIAKAAKKKKSSLYYYFNSKEQIFAQVIKKEIAGLKAAIAKAIEKEEEPQDKFRKFVMTRLNYLNAKADQYIAIKDEYLKHYECIEDLMVDYSNWEISTIQDIVEYGRDKGRFNVTDSEAIARAIFFALKGLEYPWATDLTREEIGRNIEVLVNILLKGIST